MLCQTDVRANGWTDGQTFVKGASRLKRLSETTFEKRRLTTRVDPGYLMEK